MANETKTVDPRDAKLLSLKNDVKVLETECNSLHTELKASQEEVENLQKKLDALSNVSHVPSHDCVFLGGKEYAIEKTVTAKHASDEARKGFLDLDAELIVVKR